MLSAGKACPEHGGIAFCAGPVIQRRQSRLPRYYAHRLAPNGCVGISNVGELKSRFGMFILRNPLIANESPAFTI